LNTVDYLAKVPLFTSLDHKDLLTLAASARERQYQPGEEIVRQNDTGVGLFVLTISDQDSDVMDAVVAGACGYLLKDSTIQELLRGIQAASVGESLISPSIAGKVLQRLRAASPDAQAAETILAELSDREVQVLRLIANGKDNSEIALELFISAKTVKNHISNILLKLSIQNRIQAAVYAGRSGTA